MLLMVVSSLLLLFVIIRCTGLSHFCKDLYSAITISLCEIFQGVDHGCVNTPMSACVCCKGMFNYFQVTFPDEHLGPYLHSITLIRACICNHMSTKICNKITNPFPNIREWISKFIALHNACDYLFMLGIKLNHVIKYPLAHRVSQALIYSWLVFITCFIEIYH